VGVEGSLWRALAVFRWLSLAYAAGLVLAHHDDRYAHPRAGLAVLAGMAAWTVTATLLYARSHGPVLLVADMAVALAALLATYPVEGRALILRGEPNLTVSWAVAPVLAWAVVWGVRGGLGGAVLVDVATVAIRPNPGTATIQSCVLVLLTGVVVGYVARLALDAQQRLARAVEVEAANAERERLARQIHDGVLQALALINRRGAALGGPAAELGALAATQESALRELVARPAEAAPAGAADVRLLVEAAARASAVPVEVAAPGEPVLLPAAAAGEVAAAAAAALDNVARHAGPGARAWVLVEDEGDAVLVTVRDDGVGFAPGTLDAAAARGRLGVAQSIRGRLRALGGDAEVRSGPREGTEVELRFPREVTTRDRPSGYAGFPDGGGVAPHVQRG
jgi:signal transduction histidine kinase